MLIVLFFSPYIDNVVQYCFEPHCLSLYGRKQLNILQNIFFCEPEEKGQSVL